MTTIDSSGFLRYYAIGKDEVRATIDLKDMKNTVKFLYTQRKKGEVKTASQLQELGYPNCFGEFTIKTPNETFIFRDIQKINPSLHYVDPTVRDWEKLIRNYNTKVDVQVKA
jgi:hypothetical protein